MKLPRLKLPRLSIPPVHVLKLLGILGSFILMIWLIFVLPWEGRVAITIGLVLTLMIYDVYD